MLKINMKLVVLTSTLLSMLFAIQGCSVAKGYQCMKDPYCSRNKQPIKTKIEHCESTKTGYDINSYLTPRSWSGMKETYTNYIAEEQYKDTNRTYRDLKEECQIKYEKEQNRIKELKNKKELEEKAKRQQVFDHKVALAKKNGYKGYVQYRTFDEFINDAQLGRININSYKGYVIEIFDNGTYGFKFSQLINGVEIYQPDYRYGLKLTVGIRRDKDQKSTPLEGQPLKNIKQTSFIKVDNYRTILGVNKQILMFDRAIDFRVAVVKEMLKKSQKNKK